MLINGFYVLFTNLNFQVFALIVFVFQMQQSVRKYFAGPIFLQQSTTTLDEIQPPVVYVCQKDQFNYSVSQEYGYLNFFNFARGSLMNSNVITWKSKSGNLTVEELLQIFLVKNYTNLKIANNKTEVLIYPHGYCQKVDIKSASDNILLKSTEPVYIILVDPSKLNSIRTEETEQNRVSLEKTASGYQAKIYMASYGIYDARIKDGNACKDYTKDMSYGKCVEAAFKDELVATYGCVPTWFPKSINDKNVICNQE